MGYFRVVTIAALLCLIAYVLWHAVFKHKLARWLENPEDVDEMEELRRDNDQP